jgi:hypothetical protein
MGAPTLDRSRPCPGTRAAYTARLILAALSLAACTLEGATAQNARPAVSVTATISVEAAGRLPLPIGVGPPHAVPRGSFVRVRGLPPAVALSKGYSIAPGAWAVPVADLPSLEIVLPPGGAGTSNIAVALIAPDGTVLSEARSTLVIAAAPRPPPAGQAQGKGGGSVSILRAGTPPPPAPERAEPPPPSLSSAAQPKLPPAQRERALRFVERGDELLSQGGIAQARLLYQRAAEMGLAQGAMALAATYDAAELDRLGVRGLQPDPAAARQWYERARQLGATDAAQRLRRLGAN